MPDGSIAIRALDIPDNAKATNYWEFGGGWWWFLSIAMLAGKTKPWIEAGLPAHVGGPELPDGFEGVYGPNPQGEKDRGFRDHWLQAVSTFKGLALPPGLNQARVDEINEQISFYGMKPLKWFVNVYGFRALHFDDRDPYASKIGLRYFEIMPDQVVADTVGIPDEMVSTWQLAVFGKGLKLPDGAEIHYTIPPQFVIR